MIISKEGLTAAMEQVRGNPRGIESEARHVAKVLAMTPALGPYFRSSGDGISVFAAWIFLDDSHRLHGIVVRLNPDDDLAVTLMDSLSPEVEVEIAGVRWYIEAVHQPEQLAFIASLGTLS